MAECGKEQEAIVYFSRDTARLCSCGQGPLTCLCNFSFQQRHNYNKKRGVRVELRHGAVRMVGGGHDETANIGSFVLQQAEVWLKYGFGSAFSFFFFSSPKTIDQFEYDGCDNCDAYLQMKGNREMVYDCTSSSFDG